MKTKPDESNHKEHVWLTVQTTRHNITKEDWRKMKLNEPERKNITIKVKFLSVDEARIISQNNSRLNRDTDSPVHTTLKKP